MSRRCAFVWHEAEQSPDPTRGIAHAASKPRRWKWTAGILGLVVAAASLWTWWLPQYRPSLRTGERFGIDVSNHQGDIDWRRVAHDDIHFAYIKATEGGDWVDQRFAGNRAGAADAGIDRGAYHFFTLCRSGTQQAANFLRTVPPDAELAPALDLELAGNCGRRPDQDTLIAEIKAFKEPGSFSRYDILHVEINESARRHGAADPDIRHAVAQALGTWDQADGKVLYFGPDRAGNLLEVVAVARDDGSEIVIHAMPM